MKWFKRLATNIKIIFLKAEVNEDLRKLNLGLEKENTKLRNMVIEQTEMVLQYKRAMTQMREYMNAIMHMEQERQGFDRFDENEEEEGFTESYELMKKKTTIH